MFLEALNRSTGLQRFFFIFSYVIPLLLSAFRLFLSGRATACHLQQQAHSLIDLPVCKRAIRISPYGSWALFFYIKLSSSTYSR